MSEIRSAVTSKVLMVYLETLWGLWDLLGDRNQQLGHCWVGSQRLRVRDVSQCGCGRLSREGCPGLLEVCLVARGAGGDRTRGVGRAFLRVSQGHSWSF